MIPDGREIPIARVNSTVQAGRPSAQMAMPAIIWKRANRTHEAKDVSHRELPGQRFVYQGKDRKDVSLDVEVLVDKRFAQGELDRWSDHSPECAGVFENHGEGRTPGSPHYGSIRKAHIEIAGRGEEAIYQRRGTSRLGPGIGEWQRLDHGNYYGSWLRRETTSEGVYGGRCRA